MLSDKDQQDPRNDRYRSSAATPIKYSKIGSQVKDINNDKLRSMKRKMFKTHHLLKLKKELR